MNWIGREVICLPVTGDTWHRVIDQTEAEPPILILEGGNKLDLSGIYRNERVWVGSRGWNQ